MQSQFGIERGRIGIRVHGFRDIFSRLSSADTLDASPHVAIWDNFKAELNALIDLANEVPGGFVANHVQTANAQQEPLIFSQGLENLIAHYITKMENQKNTTNIKTIIEESKTDSIATFKEINIELTKMMEEMKEEITRLKVVLDQLVKDIKYISGKIDCKYEIIKTK